MNNLYELAGKIKELDEMSGDDEMLDAITDTIELISEDFNDNVVDLVKLITNKQSFSASIKDEVKRLTDLKTINDNFVKRLKTSIIKNMEEIGIKKIPSELFNITLVKGRDVVIIDDVDELDDVYVNVKTTITPNKKLILDASKDTDVTGAHVEKSQPSLRIK